MDAALFYGVVSQSGSWFSYEGNKIAQGREQVLHYLNHEKDVAMAMRTKVLDAIAAVKQ